MSRRIKTEYLRCSRKKKKGKGSILDIPSPFKRTSPQPSPKWRGRSRNKIFMEEKRRIEQEIETLKMLQSLAQAHEEISTMKMRKTRGSVLATRDFLAALLEMFANVKSAYKKHLIEQMEKEKEKGNT